MATYTVRDPKSGKTLKLTGDSPPTAAELEQIFAKATPAAPKPSGLASAADETLRTHPHPLEGVTDEMMRAGTLKLADALPTIGGVGGGMIGGAGGSVFGVGVGGVPGAIGGAGIGGATGESARQLIRHAMGAEAPASASDAAVDIAKEGGTQAAYEAGGRVIAAAAKPAARWMMNRAMNATERLSREFPNLSQTMIDNALSVSQGGLRRARALLSQAKAGVNEGLEQAGKANFAAGKISGAKIPVQLTPELADSLKTAIVEGAIQSGVTKTGGGSVSAATTRLPKAIQQLLGAVDRAAETGQALDLTPELADAFKTQLQREVKALYMQGTSPTGLSAVPALKAIKADFAARLNDAIDAVAAGYKEGNATAQPLIGAVRGIRHAIRPGSNLYQAMVRPGVGALLGGAEGYRQGGGVGGAVGAAAGAVATSPGTMSREALILANPLFQSLLKQLPRSAALSVMQEHQTLGEAP